jgi:hypothetical protein
LEKFLQTRSGAAQELFGLFPEAGAFEGLLVGELLLLEGGNVIPQVHPMGLAQGVLVDEEEAEAVARAAQVLVHDVAQGVGEEGAGLRVSPRAHALVEKDKSMGSFRRPLLRRRRSLVPTASEQKSGHQGGGERLTDGGHEAGRGCQRPGRRKIRH